MRDGAGAPRPVPVAARSRCGRPGPSRRTLRGWRRGCRTAGAVLRDLGPLRAARAEGAHRDGRPYPVTGGITVMMRQGILRGVVDGGRGACA